MKVCSVKTQSSSEKPKPCVTAPSSGKQKRFLMARWLICTSLVICVAENLFFFFFFYIELHELFVFFF